MLQRLTASIIAGGIVTTLLACRGSGVSPTPPPNPVTSAAVVLAIALSGPPTIAPGETVPLVATATLSDGSTQDYSQKVVWRSSNAAVVTISSGGLATGQAAGEAYVLATITGFRITNPLLTVTVLPPNTYRLTGKVLESGLPVDGANVTVVSGTGAGTSTTTGYDGGYRLYGLAGSVQIKTTKSGYVDLVKTITVLRNDLLDFPDARQTDAVPSLAGEYALTLTADSGCSTEPFGRAAPLPADVRQPRHYHAVVTQEGPSLTVTLSGQEFSKPNQFPGRAEPAVVRFTIGDGYFYGPDDGINERLVSGNVLNFEGFVEATRSPGGIIGRLDGNVSVYRPAAVGSWYIFVGECRSANHQFSLTPRSVSTQRRR